MKQSQERSAEVAKIPFWRSLRFKFALSYLVLMIFALGILNTYPVFAAQEMVFKAKQSSLQNQATIIASAISSLGELTSEGVAQVMDMLDENGMTRVMITDPDGLILYDTEDSDGTPKYALIQELALALRGKDVCVWSYSAGAFRTTTAIPVMYRNAIIGGIYLYDYDGEQGSIITGLQQNLLRLSLVLMGLALLFSVLLSRTMTRRISRLIAGIGKLRKGQYSTRVKVSGRDELATLATAFNDMTQRLETTDEMRRRFVSDASHELKTPLASIKLLTDSIVQNEDMDVETVREFVQDIGSEADRLARITQKLLALTRMDNSQTAQMERSEVDLADVITDALHMLTPLADQKSVSIQLVVAQGCIVRSTPDEMYQVLFNLVENAIKYNIPEGKVWIRARKSRETVVVTIEDTGIGIPKKDRDQIFDRFYRVDKARSREAGGAGLGLSIVRDTVVANGGSISVDARPEGGTVFIVHLPLAQSEPKGETKE